jgi:hypothetical protein
MCPKVMDFVGIQKIQLNRVVKDFKQNPNSKKIRFSLEMENLDCQKFDFQCFGELSKLQVFGGMDQN